MTSYVYLIESQSGLVKIGASKYPEQRAAQIALAACSPTRLIAVWPASFREEARLHRELAPHRSHREWFRIEGAVADLVTTRIGQGVERIKGWAEVVEEALADISKSERYSRASRAAHAARAHAAAEQHAAANAGRA